MQIVPLRRLSPLLHLRHISTNIRCCQLSQDAIPKKQSFVQRYLLSRFVRFVRGYEKILETNFPSAMRVYRVFVIGFKEFYEDMKLYLKVARDVHLTGNDFRTLKHKDIVVYFQMPRDIVKVTPFLLISALPFANYVIFPVAYMYPRLFLCPHFWSLQQRTDFAVDTLKRRLYNNRPVFRCVQARLKSIKDPELFQSWRHTLSLIGSGVHPDVSSILKAVTLFKQEPYHLNCLYSNHVNSLLRMWKCRAWFRRRRRLSDLAFSIHEMDLAIAREDVRTLSQDELRAACFLRGLNPVNMKTDDQIAWIQQWLTVSKEVDESSFSLLLHCPILLAYNQPTNWLLIH